MLVLSRRKGESIKISDNITITIVDIRGDKIQIGIAVNCIRIKLKFVLTEITRNSELILLAELVMYGAIEVRKKCPARQSQPVRTRQLVGSEKRI